MKRSIVILTLVFITISSLALASEGIRWVTLKDGMERSKAEKKAMIIDFFFGPECPRCAKLQKEVYDEPAIAKKIMDDFVPVRVDLTKKLTKEEERLGEKYEYKNDCLLLFMDYDNNLLKDKAGKKLCFVDKVDPDEFIQYLDHIKASLNKTK
ncbi:MAG: thioredoxin family protein [Nitrospirae bacterium]|nr:thioredoxin family protein [Nitrospirota bacterium]